MRWEFTSQSLFNFSLSFCISQIDMAKNHPVTKDNNNNSKTTTITKTTAIITITTTTKTTTITCINIHNTLNYECLPRLLYTRNIHTLVGKFWTQVWDWGVGTSLWKPEILAPRNVLPLRFRIFATPTLRSHNCLDRPISVKHIFIIV